jgi:hypothetical protein
MENMTPFLLMLSVMLSRQLHSPQSAICNNIRQQKLVRAHHEVSRDWAYPVTSHHE